MKKLIYILMLLAAPVVATSCSSDDDLPEVVITASFDGLWGVNGQYYAVANETLQVESVQAAGLGGKPAALSNVTYFWNGVFVGQTLVSPFSYGIVPQDAGRGLLAIHMMILQEDKTVTSGTMNVGISVVNSEDDLPEGAEPVNKLEVRMTPGENS